ncbi:MAG: serine/threonine-protein kinase, partial [Vicinamibacteria bacterium]
MTSSPQDPKDPHLAATVSDEDATVAREPQTPLDSGVPVRSIPERFGRYRILRAIGRGGMGAVFEARQEQPDRSVALKVISADYLSESLLRRFEHETQVLGKLQHPGIAQIYEAGTIYDEHGRAVPFFAMEYIRGTELLRYATDHSLGTRARLELMAGICDAVGHAHQKGVIHRDLKPSNILVDEKGQPKILDFGVARATDSDVHTTQLTDMGQLIGTLPYMSPEQAGGEREDLDTRSDVYALGVITYELLAGRRPYDVDRRMVHEAVRVIREEEPTPLSGVNRELRGDVETIVAKSLEKEKTRRYQTAEAFAADIRHYLKDEPIAARPASSWYQAQKFAKRNKVLVSVLSTAFLLLAMGFLTTAWQAKQARAQRDKAEKVVAFMTEMIAGAGPYVALGRDSTLLKEMMTAAAARIEKG